MKQTKIEVEKNQDIKVPVLIFKNRKLGTLENLVLHLKTEHQLRNVVIARLINRNDKTIHQILKQCKKKDDTTTL